VDHTACEACPEGIAQTSKDGACTCAAGYYNTSHRTKCIAADFTPTQPAPLTCQSCDELAECTGQCQIETLELLLGWTLLARTDASVSIFQCKHTAACERRSNVSLTGIGIMGAPVCATGYTGVLCGACSAGYKLESDGECTACGTTTWITTTLVGAGLVFGFFVATQIRKWFDSFTWLEGLLDLMQDLHLKALLKLMVVTAQIAASFAPVLNIQMPPVFASFLRVLGFFNFDVSFTIGVGCFSNGSYVTSLATSFGLVAAVVVMVGTNYLYQSHKIRREMVSAVADSPSVHGSVLNKTELIRAMFDRFDKNKNGTIELEEMIQVIHEIDESASQEQITALFQRADTDGNGALDFEEFFAAITMPVADGGLDLGALLRKLRTAQGSVPSHSLGL
jgi:hypothetical protein